MLLYTKKALPKAPKRRSRAGKQAMHRTSNVTLTICAWKGCIHCKGKKKKCNEKRPTCDRCEERNLQCEYEPVKPRKRRKTSFTGSLLSQDTESTFCRDQWPGRFDYYDTPSINGTQNWELESYRYPESDESIEWDTQYENGPEVEEIIREEHNSEPTTILARPRSDSTSYYADLAMIAPSPVVSPLIEFCSPVYEEFTPRRNRRALVDHFCNVLSHLIVFKEDTGNPFRQLVLPLSHASSPVMNAIFALSSAHLEYRGIENEEKSLDFHNKALQGLARLIDQNDESKREEVLGAIMLLVYYEVLVQRGNSNIVNGHLKGAMTIMKSGPRIKTPTSSFLERAFRFYDVIAALSLGTSPNTNTQPCSSPYPIPPTERETTETSPLNAVDTLLGLVTDLWPIIHRLSHLLSHKQALQTAISNNETSKATVLRTELENNIQAIELALTNWKPTMPPSLTVAENPRIQSILANAEAYRHSSFIYLYRTIQSFPRSGSKVQSHTHASLKACAEVIELGDEGPMSALLWPLFVASCEATTEEDRENARKAFEGTERRQGMNNIARTWEVVGEVWRRVDACEWDDWEGEEVDWRGICREWGICVVFG